MSLTELVSDPLSQGLDPICGATKMFFFYILIKPKTKISIA